jgi:type II secretory pathway component PulK
MSRASRGLALLIVVGVLGLLAVLATAFVTMAQLERRASQQRLFATKAFLLARSGLEDALARLAAGQDLHAVSNRYFGEDWDAYWPFHIGKHQERLYGSRHWRAEE